KKALMFLWQCEHRPMARRGRKWWWPPSMLSMRSVYRMLMSLVAVTWRPNGDGPESVFTLMLLSVAADADAAGDAADALPLPVIRPIRKIVLARNQQGGKGKNENLAPTDK